MKTSRSKRLFAVNILATLGYLSCVAQWLWLVVVYGPLIASSPLMRFLPDPQAAQHTPEPAQAASEPSVLIFIVVAIITVLVLVATALVVWKLPKTVGKTGGAIAHKTAAFAVPIITHHKEIQPAKRRVLTGRIVIVFKLLILVVPLTGSLLAFLLSRHPLEYRVIAFLALFFAVGTTLWFGTQYVAAKLLKVPIDKIW